MLEFLYSVTIYPVEFVIGVLFGIFSDLFGNVGFSIVGVSVSVSALCLPLYAVAERWQSLERDKQRAMKPKIDSIKAVFKGDEQYMILSTYYRQNKYHPIYSLRSTFGLLIQVPFFIAAYHLISTLPNLANQAFWFMPDLGKPDGLLTIGAFSINLLPILMTALNLASSMVYTRGFALKDKVQLWVMALLFLFLLYGSPSGLVFYWTLNNLFSLVKNFVYKAKNPLRVAYAIVAVLAVSLTFVYVSRFHLSRIKTLFVEVVCAVVVIAPPAFALARKALRARAAKRAENGAGANPASGDLAGDRAFESARARVFWLSCAACAVFAGFTLPAGLIASSSVEFASALGNKNPLGLLLTTLFQSIGLFLVWPGCLYLLFSGKTRRAFSVLAPIALFAAIANAWLFRGNYGTISSFLIFDNSNALIASKAQALASLACLIAIAGAVVFLSSRRRAKFLAPVTAIALVGLVAVAGLELPKISGEWRAYSKRISLDAAVGKDDRIYRFTKTGRNVCVIMLDRAIGSFAGEVLSEDASLKDSFAGFTWYPNAASFGPNTLLASPAMYGGYDYVPDEINARSGETLVKKHNEALTVLPRFFTEAGWNASVTDMSWANYSWVPDNSIFAAWPSVRAANLSGALTVRWLNDHEVSAAMTNDARLRRNALCFSMFRMLPMPARWFFYHNGDYWMPALASSKSFKFLEKFAPLDYLAELSDFDAKGDSFNYVVNDSTHEPAFLQYPAYEIKEPVTDRGPDRFASETTWKMFHANAAAYRALGRFFDAMRAAGVYDNTRIIVVSDHGNAEITWKDASRFPGYFKDQSISAGWFNPLLMVKDFSRSEPFAEDQSFMTNADVPELATGGGLFANPANPYTGRPFAADGRKDLVRIFPSFEAVPEKHSANLFVPQGKETLTVRDDVRVESNWEWQR